MSFNSQVCYFCYRNAYHGTSPGTLGILAHNTWKLNVPVGFGFYQVKKNAIALWTLSTLSTYFFEDLGEQRRKRGESEASRSPRFPFLFA